MELRRHAPVNTTVIYCAVLSTNALWLPMGLYLVTGLLVSYLAGRLHTSRKNAEAQARQVLREREHEREAAIEFLHLVNESAGVHELIEGAVRYFRNQSGCEAVGIRLRQGEDYPYYEARGFPEEFVRAENSLCARCETGEIQRDSQGNPVLECMCGNVIRGRFDPSKPFFTQGGSFWTNSTTELLAGTTPEDRQANTRNRCHGEGYESVALIPLRVGEQRLGLVQINDRRRGVFTPELIAYWERLAGYMALALAQVRAQEELRETKAILQAAMDQSPAGIAIADAPDGRLRYVNDAGLLIRGGDRVSIVKGIGIDLYVDSWHLLDFDGRPLKPDEVPLARAIMYGETCSREFIIRRTADDDRMVLAKAAPVCDDHGKVVAGIVVFMDITERKRVEEALRESEEKFRLMSQLSPAGLYLTTPGGECLYANEAWCTMAGLTQDEALGMGWIRGLHPDDRQSVFDAWEKMVAAHGQWGSEYRFQDREGKTTWVYGVAAAQRDADGKIIRYIGVNTDITERKRAEEALRESEADLNRAQALAHVGNWSWDNQKDVVTWSAEMYRIYGVNPATFERTVDAVAKLIHPDDLPRQIGAIEALLQGRPFEPFEYRVVRPDGGVRVVQVSSAEVERDAAGRPVRMFGTAQDITERKQVEDALKFLAQCGSSPDQNFFEELALFLAQSLAMDYVCIDRLQEGSQAAETLAICFDGKFEANMSYSLKDTPCGVVVGKTICCFPERVREQFPNDVVLQEMRAESYVGTTLWSSQGRPIGLIAVISRRPLTDASLATSILQLTAVRAAGELERKQAEEALRASEQEFRTLTEAMPQIVWATRFDGWTTYFNQQWVEYTGLTLEESYGNNWSKPFHPDDRQRAWEAWQRATRNDEPYALECRLRRFDGVYRWWLIRGVPLRDASGKIVKWFGTCTDIENIKNTEAALVQAKEAAEAASKAKGHFLAVLSHELRNPLNPVLATATMLQKNTSFDADTQEQLDIIRRNVELEARLIDDLLDVTRIERGKVELDRWPIELGTVIHRAAEVCRPDIENRKLAFRIDLGSAPYWVHADAARLQQVFWNLLKNAIKFTPEGGSVGVRCYDEGSGDRGQGAEGRILSSAPSPPPPFVIVEVTDSGVGIEPEAVQRIFNAFEQAERSQTRQFGGLGLGLAISKALVEMHGGTIEAYSEGRGRGATFRMRLPRLMVPVTPPAAVTTAIAAPAEASASVRPMRILLVEDHDDTVRIMRRVLTMEGHQVESAGDVATGLKLAQARTFDILLSDLGLPDGSGLDLMRALRSAGCKLPGIAISGYGQEQDVAQSLAAGFAVHLTKPVNLQRLVEVIRGVAEGG